MSEPDRGDAGADAFVLLLRWTAREAGGVEALATGSGVAVRTLQDWLRGRYPRDRSSPKVERVHEWALGAVRGYPPPSAPVGGLADLAGPLRVQLGGGPVPAPVGPAPGVDAAPGSPRWGRRGALAGAALVAIAAVTVGAVLLARPASSRSHLPSGPTSPAYTEQAAFDGATTFADPRRPSGQGRSIPPMTRLEVGCWLHAPSIPSVSPDGNWYLLLTPPYAGLWSPANSYFNGDAPHALTVHNTDFHVPECR